VPIVRESPTTEDLANLLLGYEPEPNRDVVYYEALARDFLAATKETNHDTE